MNLSDIVFIDEPTVYLSDCLNMCENTLNQAKQANIYTGIFAILLLITIGYILYLKGWRPKF